MKGHESKMKGNKGNMKGHESKMKGTWEEISATWKAMTGDENNRWHPLEKFSFLVYRELTTWENEIWISKSPRHHGWSKTGWWFGCHFLNFPRNIGFRLSSQLTCIFFTRVALAHQPAKKSNGHPWRGDDLVPPHHGVAKILKNRSQGGHKHPPSFRDIVARWYHWGMLGSGSKMIKGHRYA